MPNLLKIESPVTIIKPDFKKLSHSPKEQAEKDYAAFIEDHAYAIGQSGTITVLFGRNRHNPGYITVKLADEQELDVPAVMLVESAPVSAAA